MTRTRLALGALISAAALALAGCGVSEAPTASWHGAAAQSGLADGGQGGGAQAHPISDSTAQAGKPSASASAAPSASASAAASPSASAPASASSDGIMRQTGGAQVALTFDDGPSADTPKLLAMLRQQNIKATFCVVGVAVQEFPQYVQEIVKDGHTLCNHTWKHDEKLGKKSADTIRADLQRTNDEIRKAVPDAQIKYFRHPGGNFTPTAVQVARELGMISLGWTVDPSDWNTQKWKGDQMTQHIIATVRNNTRPGGVILSHDGGGDRSATLAAYKTLLPELKQKYTLIALPN
ncbi:polysaccharide deacetylase family protein [Dactylosporangium aurantiacum]|uniref:Polysaccharide deacetylase family protein n=1 Tax=Dactylosporangium aurantiacum TaxID=35754 RepID=A0A9Q9IK75_9ACTN|nr:polysaccharide deacetylase family protein [Dactylosporangium aurantiacum]MDG6109087.1 polysaccharide deacetylase family protein [Dactylosporangium aurantiacum]UWZ54583.1 polysaccharide deacetylase family protein [Dactylosporangium aurantiacum]